MTDAESIPRSRRRSLASGPVRAARIPARLAAPLGPAETPNLASSSTAESAAWSVTAMAVSQPSRRTGHAVLEGVPQLRPAMTVASVGTDTRSPMVRLDRTHAALVGSTDRMAG